MARQITAGTEELDTVRRALYLLGEYVRTEKEGTLHAEACQALETLAIDRRASEYIIDRISASRTDCVKQLLAVTRKLWDARATKAVHESSHD